ncbi:MAG TPA: cytochrome b [Phenylobacterium sp.]|jgi:cytochrome b561|uniref:cytochrome b n=1 Tax=Phenylobacterium sp. TaxID=1871053 RepID=UPI002D722B3B|nr:cytochrome b [Phenylobacterium sp.]HZZ68910.1 cytochrome b [Phenylobacterium sp.]
MNALVTLPPQSQLAVAPARFDAVSRAFHWISVALIVVLFASAWSLSLARDGEEAAQLLTLHRSLGVTIWVVALARLTWRLRFAVRPPLPRSLPAAQRLAAAVTEGALYVLMLVQPITGLVQSLARGKPFQLFIFEAPRVMARDKPLVSLFHEIHEATAWLLLGLIGLHVAAALFHGLVRRDGVLRSMAPWPARSTRP